MQNRLLELHVKMVTYDTKTKTARELKEEISGLKKKIKVIDAEDRDLRLRITAFKTSLEKMNTMSVSLRWMKSRLSQGREKGGRLESDYDEKKEVYRRLIFEVGGRQRIQTSFNVLKRCLRVLKTIVVN